MGGRNASLGEPAAYQARGHGSGVGMGSVRPPEQRAVRDVLACSCWHCATNMICCQGSSVEGGEISCTMTGITHNLTTRSSASRRP